MPACLNTQEVPCTVLASRSQKTHLSGNTQEEEEQEEEEEEKEEEESKRSEEWKGRKGG